MRYFFISNFSHFVYCFNQQPQKSKPHLFNSLEYENYIFNNVTERDA